MLWTIFFSALTLAYAKVDLVVDEESPVNTLIGNINGIIEVSQGSEFLLSEDSYFKISNQGDITLAKPLDLESLCRDLVKCCNKSKDCIMNVVGMNKKTTDSFEFDVRVRDVNDFTPKFPTDPIVLEVRENSNIGNDFIFDKASDGDFSQANNQVSYELGHRSNITEYFSLNDQSEPKLTIFKQLDYEQVQSLSGTIRACDNQQKCSEAAIIVKVIDENDNEPSFERSEYNIEINEDHSTSTVVEQFIAIDKDSEENSQMSFWFDKASTDDETLEYFEIERETGKLFLTKPLSIKARNSFDFKVSVGEGRSSSSNQRYTDITHIKIKVKDVNDNPPTIREFPMSNSIEENVKKPFLVAFSVSDNDEGENARTRCELVSGKGYLQISESDKPGTYKIFQTRPFDAEKEDFIIVDVICSDYGSPPMNTRKSWKIKVLDKNEFRPKMERESYQVEIAENSPKRTHILKISAQDEDRDSELVYALDTVGQQFFHINAQTGEIEAIGGEEGSSTQLNFEQMPQITFIVSATDYQDDLNYQTKAEVTVKLIDVNDNVPKIEVVEPFRIHENVQGRNRIDGKIFAEDLDQGPNGNVHFKMENSWDSNGNTMNDRISIDTDGNLYTLSLIDRETIPEITVTLVACDEGSSLPNGRSFCSPPRNFTIEILDENDNTPEWIYPLPEKMEALNLTTDYPVGSHVTFLRAIDPDHKENGRLTYELIDPMRQTVFIVNSSTGELMVNPNATSQNPLLAGRYELHLKVSDNGRPPRTASSRLIISVATSEAMVNAQINFYIIIIMIILTSVISVCLIIAIICVRRKPKNGLLGLGSTGRSSAAQYNTRRCNDTQSGFYGSQFCYPVDAGQKTSIYKHETSPNSGLVNYESNCLEAPYGQIMPGKYYTASGTLGSTTYNPQMLLASQQNAHSISDVNNQGSLSRTSTPADEGLMTRQPTFVSTTQGHGSVVDVGHSGTLISTFGHSNGNNQRSDSVCLSTGYRQISPGTLLFSNAQMSNASPIGPLHIVDHVDGDSADSGRGPSEDDHHQHLLQQQYQMNLRSNSPSHSITNQQMPVRFVHNPNQNHYYKFGSVNKNSLLRQYPEQIVSLPENCDEEQQKHFPIHPNLLSSNSDIMKEDRV